MKVDVAKLKLFIEVLDAGSITAGAGRCHLSVAAASSRLQELESALNDVSREAARVVGGSDVLAV